MNNLKTKYKSMFNIVRDELNKVDPIGVVLDNQNLIDEYDFENQKILSSINEVNDYKDLANIICDVFIKSTKSNFDAEEFYDCAKNILEKIKNS